MNSACGMSERSAQCHGAAEAWAGKTFKAKLLSFLCQLQNCIALGGRCNDRNCWLGIRVCRELRQGLTAFVLTVFSYVLLCFGLNSF